MSFAGLLSIVAPVAPVTGDGAPASTPGSDVAAEFEALLAAWNKSAPSSPAPEKNDQEDEVAVAADVIVQPAPLAVTPPLIAPPVIAEGGPTVSADGETASLPPPVTAPVVPPADLDTAAPAPQAGAADGETVRPPVASGAPATDTPQPARPTGAEAAAQPARTASPAQAPAETTGAAAAPDVPAVASTSTPVVTPTPRADTGAAPAPVAAAPAVVEATRAPSAQDADSQPAAVHAPVAAPVVAPAPAAAPVAPPATPAKGAGAQQPVTDASADVPSAEAGDAAPRAESAAAPAPTPAPTPAEVRPLPGRAPQDRAAAAQADVDLAGVDAPDGEAGAPAANVAGDTAAKPAVAPSPVVAPGAPAAPAAVNASADTAAPATPEAQATQDTIATRHEVATSTLSRATVETTAMIAAQIMRRLEGRSTRFEMALTPDDLGRVDVSMEVGADGALTARLAFDNPAAAAELRGRADELRRQLQDAGFQLSQDSLQFAERDASSGRGFDRRQDRAFAGAARVTADADVAAPPPGRWTPLTLSPQGVDMKV